MENSNKRQSLLKLIPAHLNMAPESTLEKVLELLEDEEDMLVMKSQAQKLTVLYLGMNISKKERGR